MNVDNRKKNARIISGEDKAQIGQMMHSCTYAHVYNECLDISVIIKMTGV